MKTAPAYLCLLVLLCACSAQSRQMRKTQAISKRNVQRQEAKAQSGGADDPSGLPAKDDVNYKDLAKIRAQCLYVKNGKRCTRNAGNQDYCRRHRRKAGENIRRRE